MEDTKEWIDLVQRKPCYMRRIEHPDELTLRDRSSGWESSNIASSEC